MTKFYYANVDINAVKYFERRLTERKVVIIKRTEKKTSNTNEPYYNYILRAKEGVIDQKFELKFES